MCTPIGAALPLFFVRITRESTSLISIEWHGSSLAAIRSITRLNSLWTVGNVKMRNRTYYILQHETCSAPLSKMQHKNAM
jgi:hypothetical protein